MVIQQGDVYWVDLGEPSGSEPGYRRPYIVVQNNLFNQSRIKTVVLASLTPNLERAKSPGNVLLDKGEAGLSKTCVVNVTQLFTADKTHLVEYIGSLDARRISQIVAGIGLVIRPAEVGA
jgi:mRNA interferase MazF